MKQIFDWLREQINEGREFEHDERNECLNDGLDYAIRRVDEAEAKWESVMSELEKELKLADEEKERCSRENPLQFDTAKSYANGISNAIEIIKGKPIKISEVE